MPAQQALRRSAGGQAEWWPGRGRLAGDILSRLYQLLLFKGRAVGGGLSNGRRGACTTKRSLCACAAGSEAQRRRAGGVVAGARPLGGVYIPLLGRGNPK